MPPNKFPLNLSYDLGWFLMNCDMAAILDIRNRRILATLYLQVALITHTKFHFNQTCFGRCHLENFKMAAIWTSERNGCSNSESSCCLDASHQVLVQCGVGDNWAVTWDFNNVVCATSKASDQPAHTHSLIRAFASHLHILWVFSYWQNNIWRF